MSRMSEDHPIDHPEADSETESTPTTSPREPLLQLEDVAVESPEDARVRVMMEHSIDLSAFTPAVEAMDAPDAADALEELDLDDAADVVHEMTDLTAAQDLAEMQTPLAITLLEDLAEEHGPEEPAKYITLMDLDDAADILQEMPSYLRQNVFDHVPVERANRLRMLLSFDPESAGGMMRPDCLVFDATGTKEDAIEQLRTTPWWKYHRVFCVDSTGKLVGEVTMRALIIAPDGSFLSDLMGRDIEILKPDLDQEEIADAFERYEYTLMPVVDDEDKLLGIVTVDDVIEVIQEEHTEDAYRMVGAGKSEAVYSSLGEKFRGRIPWLVVNLFTSLIAAFVVYQFQDTIVQIAMLAVLMPMIANQAGNAGQQSLAVTLRGLVLNEVRTKHIWPLILRETALGLLTGLLVGTLVGILVGILSIGGMVEDASWTLGGVVALAMTGSLAVGCMTGTLVPLLLHYLKRDPATASTIFLTMVTDSMSFLTFLGLAKLFVHLAA